jgi:predicted dehydrogenase
MNTRDAKRILDCVQNSGVSLTVNYNWLMGKAMQNGLQAVRRGEIGRPLGIRVECLHTKDDPMTSDEGHWCHLLPGGRFGEMLSHPVYILQAVMGDELDLLKVHAEKRGLYPWMRYDELNALLKAENGTGSIYVSFNAPRLSTVVDVFGTEKIMRIDLANQTCLEMGYRGLRKSDLALDSLDLSRKLFFSTLRKTFTYLLPHPGQAAFQGTYESLIDCIQNDKPLLVTAKMAYNTVKTVEVICNEL